MVTVDALAVQAAMSDLVARFPEDGETIERAAPVVLEGRVTRLARDAWDVQGSEAMPYRVRRWPDRGTCTCPAYSHGAGRRCKHIHAVNLCLTLARLEGARAPGRAA